MSRKSSNTDTSICCGGDCTVDWDGPNTGWVMRSRDIGSNVWTTDGSMTSYAARKVRAHFGITRVQGLPLGRLQKTEPSELRCLQIAIPAAYVIVAQQQAESGESAH